MWKKENPCALLVRMQTGAATVENSMGFPQKTKNGAAFWPSIPPLGMDPKNPEMPEEYRHCYVHSIVVDNSQGLEIAEVPISKWVDKKAVLHLHSGIPCGCKKGPLTFYNSMDGPRVIILSEINWSVKGKYHMISLTCWIE